MNVEHLMAAHGVKVTANRLLIARALEEAHRPLSMMELEARLESIDKSNVFRTLVAFKDAHLVHVPAGERTGRVSGAGGKLPAQRDLPTMCSIARPASVNPKMPVMGARVPLATAFPGPGSSSGPRLGSTCSS